jgi:hypothetical protein
MSANEGRPLLRTQPDSASGHDRSEGHDGAYSAPTPPCSSLALDAVTVEAIARRTVELLRSDLVPASPDLVDAAQVAVALGVSRQWVYEHAENLGGERLGDGVRPRWRFDLEVARRAGSRSASKRSQAQEASDRARSDARPSPRRRRLPDGLPQPGSVLPIRPRSNGKPGVKHAA